MPAPRPAKATLRQTPTAASQSSPASPAEAAFAIPALYEDLLTRPRGRASHAPPVRCRSLQYQVASWDRPRRVIAKVEHHLGELFPRVGFIVTTLTGTNRAVVHFYN